MLIDFREYLSYMCPACGNYFYRSNVRSYNTFDATVFSDGYTHACHNPYWLTRCPKCKQFFAKEHLFEMLESICTLPMDPRLSSHTKRKIEDNKLFGRLDGYFDDNETKADFIEKAIAQGLYYPVTVHDSKKSDLWALLHKDLWHEYNMHRDKISDETYEKLCKDIIDITETKMKAEQFIYYADKLSLAELYRNVGEFDKCIALLDTMNRNNNTATFIDCIHDQALKKNQKTVVLKEI